MRRYCVNAIKEVQLVAKKKRNPEAVPSSSVLTDRAEKFANKLKLEFSFFQLAMISKYKYGLTIQFKTRPRFKIYAELVAKLQICETFASNENTTRILQNVLSSMKS